MDIEVKRRLKGLQKTVDKLRCGLDKLAKKVDAEPKPAPEYKVGQYVTAMGGVARVVETQCRPPKSETRYQYADGDFGTWPTRRLSPWTPVVGESVWVKGGEWTGFEARLRCINDAERPYALIATDTPALDINCKLSELHPIAFAPKPEKPKPEKPKFPPGTLVQNDLHGSVWVVGTDGELYDFYGDMCGFTVCEQTDVASEDAIIADCREYESDLLRVIDLAAAHFKANPPGPKEKP